MCLRALIRNGMGKRCLVLSFLYVSNFENNVVGEFMLLNDDCFVEAFVPRILFEDER